eukprot:364808-Chlamydomonas_euryale.AAC.18
MGHQDDVLVWEPCPTAARVKRNATVAHPRPTATGSRQGKGVKARSNRRCSICAAARCPALRQQLLHPPELQRRSQWRPNNPPHTHTLRLTAPPLPCIAAVPVMAREPCS